MTRNQHIVELFKEGKSVMQVQANLSVDFINGRTRTPVPTCDEIEEVLRRYMRRRGKQSHGGKKR